MLYNPNLFKINSIRYILALGITCTHEHIPLKLQSAPPFMFVGYISVIKKEKHKTIVMGVANLALATTWRPTLLKMTIGPGRTYPYIIFVPCGK